MKKFQSILLIILFSACQKQEFVLTTLSTGAGDEPISKSRTVSLQSSGSQWVAQIPYPTVSTATQIFKSEQSNLQNVIAANNESLANEFVMELANKIAGLYFYKKGIDIRSDFVDNPNGIIILGLFSAAREYHFGIAPTSMVQNISKSQKNVGIAPLAEPDDMDCFLVAVQSIIGIPQARSIWRSILAGAAEETIIGAVRLIGRRVGVGITIGIAIYDVGGCLGWW
jgi:hypothetical protein